MPASYSCDKFVGKKIKKNKQVAQLKDDLTVMLAWILLKVGERICTSERFLQPVHLLD